MAEKDDFGGVRRSLPAMLSELLWTVSFCCHVMQRSKPAPVVTGAGPPVPTRTIKGGLGSELLCYPSITYAASPWSLASSPAISVLSETLKPMTLSRTLAMM